jgi:thiol-disulfide isomerase/thioredoxin
MPDMNRRPLLARIRFSVLTVIFGTLLGTLPALAADANPPMRASAPAATPLSAPAFKEVLAKQRGKVVLLNLWGTWCVPCLREIPDPVAVENELGPRGMVLLGVAMDEAATLQSTVEPFRLKFFPQFRTWVRGEPDMDTLVSVVDPAWNEILPTSYLIDRNGKVIKKIQGKKTREEFRALVDAAL